jgi:hypothetical protein
VAIVLLVVGELVGELVVGASVVGESPPVVTLGEEEHAAPSKARARTHAASPARRCVIRRSGECDGFTMVEVRFVMTTSCGSPVRFTKIEVAAAPRRGAQRKVIAAGGWVPRGYRHPDGDVVVVTPIGFAPKDAREFYRDYVPRDWFVTPDNFTGAALDEGERQPLAWPYGPGDEPSVGDHHADSLTARLTARTGLGQLRGVPGSSPDPGCSAVSNQVTNLGRVWAMRRN